MTPINSPNGLQPYYVGVHMKAEYFEFSSEKRKYSAYNWIYYQNYSGAMSSAFIATDAHNLNNAGPFYYGEGDGKTYLAGNNLYTPISGSTLNFTGEMTLYGQSGNDWIQIGTVTYGFTYSNGTLTPQNPVITYNKNGR